MPEAVLVDPGHRRRSAAGQRDERAHQDQPIEPEPEPKKPPPPPKKTIDLKGEPHQREGQEAAEGMKTRLKTAAANLESLIREIVDGTARKWTGLKIEGRMPAREGAEVYSGDEKIGVVTSGGFSPSLGYPIAVAYVASAHAAQGTALEIEVRNKRLPATVVPMPFVPHRYYRGSK